MTNPEDLLPAIATEASGLATDLLAVTRAEVERLVGLRRKAEETLAAARGEAQRLVADARASAEAELARRWSDTEHACGELLAAAKAEADRCQRTADAIVADAEAKASAIRDELVELMSGTRAEIESARAVLHELIDDGGADTTIN